MHCKFDLVSFTERVTNVHQQGRVRQVHCVWPTLRSDRTLSQWHKVNSYLCSDKDWDCLQLFNLKVNNLYQNFACQVDGYLVSQRKCHDKTCMPWPRIDVYSYYASRYYFYFYYILPCSGERDTEFKVTSDKNTELKDSPFKACCRSLYSNACYAYCQGFLPHSFLPFQSIHLHFFQNLSKVFPMLAVLNVSSCVGPQNTIGVPMEYK